MSPFFVHTEPSSASLKPLQCVISYSMQASRNHRGVTAHNVTLTSVVLVLGGMTKNVYQGIFKNSNGFTVYEGIFCIYLSKREV